jgi:hypothetical protein
MTYFAPCCWCDQLAPLPNHRRKAPPFCPACGHDPHEAKALCKCDKCLAFAHRNDQDTVEITVPVFAHTTPKESA